VASGRNQRVSSHEDTKITKKSAAERVAEKNEKSQKKRRVSGPVSFRFSSIFSFLSANNSCQENKMLRLCGAEAGC
jgi:hypothetical protein